MALHGREAELKELGELVDGPEDRSGVVLRGEAGIGKSALVAETAAAASVAGLRVLRTAGAEAERNLAYAGLHRLLHPVRAGVAELPAPQRDALRTALGLADAGEPSAYLVGLAALTLLAEEAAAKPLLLVADDVHWLDRESADVLAFVARRIETEPIVMVATLREGAPSPLLDAGLTPMVLERLGAEEAADLLDAVAPHLAPAVRTRLLTEAAGHPLALTELPSALADFDGLDPVLPLTERLERTFTARVTGLPAATRMALLVAALNETTALAETLTATAGVLRTDVVEPEIFTPAVEARLVELSAGAVTFRHPLMRSALPAAATPGERRRAQLALVEALRDQPDRRAWHQAAATAGPDETVAGELDRAAERARYRGGAGAAIAALEQAARLSEQPGHRTERLLKAAELAVESGRRETAERLVRAADPVGKHHRATASRLLSEFEDGVREDPARVAELAVVAESAAKDGETAAALRILWSAAMRCF